MSMPDCTPVDGWDTILVCDNVNGVEDLGTSKDILIVKKVAQSGWTIYVCVGFSKPSMHDTARAVGGRHP